MTAADRAAAVQIVADALRRSRVWPWPPEDMAVAALDEAKLLRRPDEAEYVAALETMTDQDGPTELFKQRWPGIPPQAHPLLMIDRDAAIEAGVVAARVDRLPEHDDTIAEMVALGISVALDYLASLPYPVRLGPAAGVSSRPLPADPGSSGEDDAPVWVPPRSDCMEHRPDLPCPHCGGTLWHHRTRRCGECGRRPAAGPAPAQEAAFTELVQLGQAIQPEAGSGEA